MQGSLMKDEYFLQSFYGLFIQWYSFTSKVWKSPTARADEKIDFPRIFQLSIGEWKYIFCSVAPTGSHNQVRENRDNL